MKAFNPMNKTALFAAKKEAAKTALLALDGLEVLEDAPIKAVFQSLTLGKDYPPGWGRVVLSKRERAAIIPLDMEAKMATLSVRDFLAAWEKIGLDYKTQLVTAIRETCRKVSETMDELSGNG